jgi:hypothetical protein
MSFKMTSLLVHDEQVPESVRVALRAAQSGSDGRRLELLESAARILHRETGIGCIEARELVDLQEGGCEG